MRPTGPSDHRNNCSGAAVLQALQGDFIEDIHGRSRSSRTTWPSDMPTMRLPAGDILVMRHDDQGLRVFFVAQF
jgi:hypothetical protein